MRLRTRSVTKAFTTIAVLLLFVQPVLAHGFGNRYELALPTWLFFVGNVSVVLVSFAIVSVFAGGHRKSFVSEGTELPASVHRFAAGELVVQAVRTGIVLLCTISVLAGFVGPQTDDANLHTLLVWVVWWIGYTFSVILIGNTWPAVNPWKTVYEWMVVVVGRDPSLRREYRWGALPAVSMLFGFGWLEIVSPISASPRGMAVLTAAYSVVTWTGMLVYGAETWIGNADPFARLYRYLGKFAPLSSKNGGEVRMYGVGLFERDDSLEETGALSFLVVILYLVTFDGFVATPAWRALVNWMPEIPIPFLVTTTLMLVGLAAFVEAYLTFARLLDRAAGTSQSELDVARRFALSLLPIAIAYQLSHYYVSLLLRSQLLIPALTDPFGLSWNLLGGGGFEPAGRIPFLTMQFVWQSQIALIVFGHVVAVWVAHRIALEAFEDRRRAVKSQLPMMGLMVAYTMLSLWILTLPVVEPVLP